MIHPTIHLNGTSKNELAEQVKQAYLGLMDAREKMFAAAPHGRDYYPQGPGAIDIAVSQHRQRLAKIEEVMEEFNELSLRIAFPQEGK